MKLTKVALSLFRDLFESSRAEECTKREHVDGSGGGGANDDDGDDGGNDGNDAVT